MSKLPAFMMEVVVVSVITVIISGCSRKSEGEVEVDLFPPWPHSSWLMYEIQSRGLSLRMAIEDASKCLLDEWRDLCLSRQEDTYIVKWELLESYLNGLALVIEAAVDVQAFAGRLENLREAVPHWRNILSVQEAGSEELNALSLEIQTLLGELSFSSAHIDGCDVPVAWARIVSSDCARLRAALEVRKELKPAIYYRRIKRVTLDLLGLGGSLRLQSAECCEGSFYRAYVNAFPPGYYPDISLIEEALPDLNDDITHRFAVFREHCPDIPTIDCALRD